MGTESSADHVDKGNEASRRAFEGAIEASQGGDGDMVVDPRDALALLVLAAVLAESVSLMPVGVRGYLRDIGIERLKELGLWCETHGCEICTCGGAV